MVDTPSPPTPPDPVATANAQANLNQSTATTQQLLNQTDQFTPNGSLTYNQTGTNSFVDANGKTITVPKFSATTTLSPAQQKIADLLNETKTNLGQIGVSQSAKIGDLLGTPFDPSTANKAVEDKIDALGAARLDPQFARSEDALRTQLANQGIQPGSAAWNAEMTQFQQGKNDAFNQLYLGGNQQAFNQAIATRNQPINETTALMSGSQVSQPNFTSTPNTGVAGVDYTGMVNNNYNAANQQYMAQVANNNAAMGGMFGLAGTLGAAGIKAAFPSPVLAFSDRRLKSDIVRIGTTAHGLPLYEYTIFGERQRGVMADEVEQVMPEAVSLHPSGFRQVNYTMLGLPYGD